MSMTPAAAYLVFLAALWSGGLLLLAIILSAHLLVGKLRVNNQNENDYSSLINNMPNAVLYFKNSRCVTANPAFFDMTGEKRIRGRYFLDYFSEADKNKIRLMIYKTRKEGRQSFQYKAQLKIKGATIPILVVVILEPVNSHLMTGYLVIYNKTKEHDLNRELEKSNKLRAAGQLASQIAHDFNNLLTPLQSYPYLIKISLPKGHKAIEYAEHLQELSYRMTDLNQQLLSMGRRYKQTFKRLDTNALVKNVISSARIPDSVKLTIGFSKDDIPINGNESQLSRVLLNLINNAVDSIDSTGKIQIQIRNDYIESVPRGFSDCKQGNYARIDITDSGMGIDPDIINDIFQPFFTTKTMNGTTGSGLGLTIVREIIKDHSGFLTVQSLKNIGTTFSMYLPISLKTDRQADSEKAAERYSIFTPYKQAACY